MGLRWRSRSPRGGERRRPPLLRSLRFENSTLRVPPKCSVPSTAFTASWHSCWLPYCTKANPDGLRAIQTSSILPKGSKTVVNCSRSIPSGRPPTYKRGILDVEMKQNHKYRHTSTCICEHRVVMQSNQLRRRPRPHQRVKCKNKNWRRLEMVFRTSNALMVVHD